MGFVGRKDTPHSNGSSLYLTLSPLTLFDTRYSECGRVLTSLHALEAVDLGSLEIADVVPLFSYQKKAEFLKAQLLSQRCKFFPKAVSLSGNNQFENFIFETTENEAEFLTGPEKLRVANVDCPSLLLRLREINLVDLRELSLSACALSHCLFKKLLCEADYLPRLSVLELKDAALGRESFALVCRLRLKALCLDNVRLRDCKVRLFPLLCLESGFFPGLRRLTLRGVVSKKDLDVLDEDFLAKWVALAGDRPFHSVNLNQLNSKAALDLQLSGSLAKASSAGKENKTSSTKKSGSKTSRKSGNKKKERAAEAGKQASLSQAVSQWTERLARFGHSLEHLDLSGNCLHDEGLSIFLRKLASAGLRSLSLKHTQVTCQSES